MTPEQQLAIGRMSQQDYDKCQMAFDLALQYFGGDDLKTVIWFCEPNKNMDNYVPRDMMINGQIDRLLKYLEMKSKKESGLMTSLIRG